MGIFFEIGFLDLLRIILIFKDVGGFTSRFHVRARDGSWKLFFRWNPGERLAQMSREFAAGCQGLHKSVANKRSKSAMWILSFSRILKSRESKVFYAKNKGCFIRIIFILYVFYSFFYCFFVGFLNFFTMYWWLINFLCIFIPPCLPN
jgi:hypothetical protein